MKILAFAATSHTKSINKIFVDSISKYYKEADDVIDLIDLNDYEIPMFSLDKERELGTPEAAQRFADKIDWADFILISFAEHNGNYSVAYKNIIDWVSRLSPRKVYNGRPVFLLATSDGAKGAQTVLNIAAARMPFDGGEVLDTFSLPEFSKSFEQGKGITNMLLRSQLEAKIRKTKRELAKRSSPQS